MFAQSGVSHNRFMHFKVRPVALLRLQACICSMSRPPSSMYWHAYGAQSEQLHASRIQLTRDLRSHEVWFFKVHISYISDLSWHMHVASWQSNRTSTIVMNKPWHASFLDHWRSFMSLTTCALHCVIIEVRITHFKSNQHTSRLMRSFYLHWPCLLCLWHNAKPPKQPPNHRLLCLRALAPCLASYELDIFWINTYADSMANIFGWHEYI